MKRLFATVVLLICLALSVLLIQSQDTITVSVEWDNSTSAATQEINYQIQISQDQQSWEDAGGLIPNNPDGITNGVFSLPKNDGDWFVRVLAKNQCCFSGPSNVLTINTNAPAPVSIRIQAIFDVDVTTTRTP